MSNFPNMGGVPLTQQQQLQQLQQQQQQQQGQRPNFMQQQFQNQAGVGMNVNVNATATAGQGDHSWQAGVPREMREKMLKALEAHFLNMCRNAKIPTFPQVARNLVEKVEAEAWRTASSQDQYQSQCRDYLGRAVSFHIHNLRKQQQQNQAIQSTQLNGGNDDQSAQQLQMLLQQQQQQQQQQQVGAQKQQPQMQATVQNQNQMQMPNQNQPGLNPMMANMIPRNFTQDTSGTLAMNMQSYIQSQQQVSQQRAQQQQQQQTPQQAQAQPQQLQQQAQQMRQQFGLSNPSVNQSNLNALNSSNLYAQQQYAANLAAAANQQRANGLSTLNQPINPAVQAQAQAQQRQQTPQVQPTQFPQVPDANTTFNQQLRNPLQTAHQFQQSLPQAEIDQIALDLARFKVYTWISKPKNIQDVPPHIRDSNDKAQQKIKGLQNMGLTGILEQIKKAINIIQPRLEAEAGIRVRQNAPAVATDESEATGLNTLQQPMNTVVQQLPQAQAAAAKQQAMNRSVNQSTLPEQSPQAQQMQNLRTQPQALPRQGAGLATPLQNVQAPVQGQNPMQTPSMNPQNMNMLQQFQLTRELANNQQLFANLNQQQTNAAPNAQQLALMAQLRNTPLARQQQPLQQQAQGLNAVNPARLIPQQANPHNFPIPAESQQRLAQNGVPRDRMSSWSEVINWIQEAHKQGILTDEQVAKFQQEYKQQGRPLSLTPRALMQQYQQQQQQAAAVSAGAASNLQAQNQQILNHMQQARQIQGQQINLQQSLQNQSQGIPPQMQMALSGIPIIPQQVQQQQAPLLQAQSSQQPPTQPQLQQPQQQPQPQALPAQAPPQPQVQPVQQRKGRPPPRKPSAKKGQDATNPLVVGNTPTPTNIPTPSPAQLHASLPTTTPVHMASPATVPHPTPQGLGISPVDPNTTHTSSHVDNPQHPDSDAQARMANVVGQIRAEMEKQRQSLSNWTTQLKELSPEQKEQMKAVIASPAVIEFLNRADKVLPFVWNHAKNEPQVQPFIQQFLKFRVCISIIADGVSKERYLCTPEEWTKVYFPQLTKNFNALLSLVSPAAAGARPVNVVPQPNAASPLVNNPAGVAISLGKHGLRQEDLHIPESKRRRSTIVGASQSPASTTDPASVGPISQTPAAMATPTSYPPATPVASGNKRPSTNSPATSQLPANKIQINALGAAPPRDRAQEEAVARRQAKEQAEALERQESRKNPLEYVKNAIFRTVGGKKSDETVTSAQPQVVIQGLADKLKKTDIAGSPASEIGQSSDASKGKTPEVLKGQLPSPPWSGTITPRQLAETFANTTDIDFALASTYPILKTEEDGTNFFSNDEDFKIENEEPSDLDFFTPFDGDLGWDDAYSWTKGLQIPWNGDISNIIESSNNMGVVA